MSCAPPLVTGKSYGLSRLVQLRADAHQAFLDRVKEIVTTMFPEDAGAV